MSAIIGKIEFDLTDPHAARMHELAVKYIDAYLCLFNVDQALRSVVKYDSFRSEEFIRGVEHARDLLHNSIIEKGIDLDEIP